MVVKREPSWYGRMERMILSETNRNVASLASVACTRNKPLKRRRPNLRPSASLLVKRKANGQKAMFNKFLQRALFLTVASTAGIVGSVYNLTHKTHEVRIRSPHVRSRPSATTLPTPSLPPTAGKGGKMPYKPTATLSIPVTAKSACAPGTNSLR